MMCTENSLRTYSILCVRLSWFCERRFPPETINHHTHTHTHNTVNGNNLLRAQNAPCDSHLLHSTSTFETTFRMVLAALMFATGPTRFSLCLCLVFYPAVLLWLHRPKRNSTKHSQFEPTSYSVTSMYMNI